MEARTFTKSALSLPSIFDFSQWLVGASRCHQRFLETFAKPASGERVVDLGCGTGATLNHLPAGVSYVGIDINPGYIRAARDRFGNRGHFICSDLATADLSAFPPFDLAVSVGVFHHLNDGEVQAVLELVRRIVRPGGRLVTLDPCYVPGQSRIARFLKDHDRGRHIRDVESYRELFSGNDSFETVVLSDMLRVPYTHIVAKYTL
jgi:SAM-dependent methyltransferase